MGRITAFGMGVMAALALGAPALAQSRAVPRLTLTPAETPFTPSLIDAPGLALKPGATVGARQFRFTPSGERRARHAVTLGVKARPVNLPEATPRLSDQPQGYDIGMALGTRGVAVSGAMSRVDAGLAQREAVTLGLGYGRHDWSTSLKLGEEDGWVRGAATPIEDKRYSVELGGAYSVGRDVHVGAGVRYRVAPDAEPQNRAPADRSAFLGLGIRF